MDSKQLEDIKNLKTAFPTVCDTGIIKLWNDLRFEQFKTDVLKTKERVESYAIAHKLENYKFDAPVLSQCPCDPTQQETSDK